jgi:hypothetical protein
MEAQSQGAEYFEDGAELRIALRRERLLETLPAQSGVSGDLDHALRPGDI